MYKKTVELDTNYLIRECSNYPILKDDLFYNFRLKNRENIHEVFKYKKFNEDFTDNLSCYNDDNHIIGFIRPSYHEFITKLRELLNIDKAIKDVDSAFIYRLKVLENISYEQELRKEFPYLYEDLIDGRKYIKSLDSLEASNENLKERLESERHYYYSCGMRKSLEGFIKTQSEVYNRFVSRKDEYKELIERRNYNGFIRDYFNMDKVALYVISEYLNKCSDEKDKEVLKRYLVYLKSYQKSSFNKDTFIVLENNKEFTNDNILRGIKNIEERLKESSRIIGWELVPSGKDYEKVHKTNKKSRRLSLSQEEIDTLKGKGQEKQDFYQNTPYLGKLLGLLKYKGYVAYIYPNGEVLLDRVYDSNKPYTALGNAIYIMKAKDFETFSKLDKSELKKEKKVKRIVHSKNWINRVNNIITKETDEKDKEEAIKLIKKFQK